MKFSIREIVLVALTVAIPMGAWWTVYRPNNARNVAMTKEVEARQAKLRELNRVTGTIGDLKMEIASLEKAIQFFRSRLPTEKEIDKVLQEVWRLAESNNLSTKSIRTLDREGPSILTDATGPYAEQPLSMKLEGSRASTSRSSPRQRKATSARSARCRCSSSAREGSDEWPRIPIRRPARLFKTLRTCPTWGPLPSKLSPRSHASATARTRRR